MNTTIKYVLYTALRDWLFIGILISIATAVFLSFFLGSTVIIEKDQMLTSFASGSSRVVLIVGMIVFVCFHVRRAFENKEIELMLSRPISRATFIISYWLGFCIVSIMLLALLGLFMILFFQFHYNGLSIWLISMTFEVMLVNAFALFAAVILRSSVSAVMLSFGFYLVSRMMGLFSYVLEKNYSYDMLSIDYISQKVIWASSYLLPRLDLFSQSNWLLYGVDFSNPAWVIPIIQSLIYIPLLLSFALIDFSKKDF